ncbi:MAG: N-6 DNA methylase [Candidatus Altiarchaeota archaeon]
MISNEIIKQEIRKLVEKYNRVVEEKRVITYNEEMTKKDFILPLFRALGWNIEDSNEVTAEEKISKKRVDYGFRINGIPKFFLEVKPLRGDLDNPKFIEQAINYAWHKGCTWAVLTNFESVKIFNAEWKTSNPLQNHLKTIPCQEFLDRFDELWLLSKESFEKGLIDKEAEKWGKKTKKITVDKQLLQDFTRFRELLSKNITKLNQSKNLTEEELDEAVQRILDRLILIRNCEDRELEAKTLISSFREWESRGKGQLIKSLREVFAYFDKQYNSKIFANHLCDSLDIDNEVLHEIIEGLYYTKDKSVSYDFSAIEADVLGNIYEQYLGHILKKSEKRAKLTENHAHRKEQGIYYTPTYIVDYIVRNTLGELLKNKKPEDVEKIRVLDPACGSGSFLIKAFDVLNEYYAKHDKNYSQTQIDFKTGLPFTSKVKILKNNIFGVDLDKQAVEIAQLNLLLKIAEKGHRLPLLQENIKCGNSLIDDPAIAGDKAFKWEEEFSDVMKEGGFDVVIGNPPYERTLYLENEKEYYSRAYVSAYGAYDILVLFIEKAIKLLKSEGYLGFIVSNKFLVSDYGKKLREFLLSNCKIIKIIDLADAKRVFPDALVSTVIIIVQKTTKNKSKYRVNCFISNENTTIFDEEKFEKVPIDKFVADNGTFNVRYNVKKDTIYKKINSLKKIGEVFDIRTGVMGFEYWKMEPYIHEGKQDTKDIRIATNSYLDRYRFLWGKEINLYKKKFKEPYVNIEKIPVNEQTKKLFLTKNKLIVRGVSKRLTAMIDEEGIGFLVAVHSILTNEEHNIKLILGILNSKLFDWIHKDRFYLGRIPEGSLKYPVSFLKELPLYPNVDKTKKERIITLVDKMLALNKRLNEIGDKKTDERAKIEEEIKKTDAEIDELVYKIYAITEEEKKIIEESLK